MKILIVRTFPNIINTQQYNMQEIGLAKALTRKGHECGIVLYNGKNRDEIEYITIACNGENKNITLYKLHGYNILKNGFFPSLRKLINQYDVIQVHEYDQLTSWRYYAWSKKPIVIYHGPYFHEFNKGYNLKCKIFDNVFLRLKHNRNVICMAKSELASEFLRKKGFLKVRTVGVGLDLENFIENKMILKEKVVLDDNKFNIIYVGKIEERRNVFFLLQVMQKICDRNPGVNCIVIGNGEREYVDTFIQKAQSLLIAGRMHYYEKISQVELAEIYKKVQIMLFPSCYEIFGMVLLEAAYFGIPVITSRNGGSDIISKKVCEGKIIDSFDLGEWVEGIESYINTEDRGQGNLLKQGISWDSIVSSFIACYEEASH